MQQRHRYWERLAIMNRRQIILGLVAFGMTACQQAPTTRSGADEMLMPNIYRITPSQKTEVQYRMLDSVNALRIENGLGAVVFDDRLNAAAAIHSRDMARQDRPWLFGSDRSTPVDRAQRSGFSGRLLGENVSETYETELQTLDAWMSQNGTRSIILLPNARSMGFAWFQEPDGRLWWTLNMGGSTSRP
jgi:uncharacterized protein YkwD